MKLLLLGITQCTGCEIVDNAYWVSLLHGIQKGPEQLAGSVHAG